MAFGYRFGGEKEFVVGNAHAHLKFSLMAGIPAALGPGHVALHKR
jgi:hypothetical protein